MLRTFTCIMCPQGCEITAEGSEAPYSITGNKCKRGHEYVEQELVNPMRNIATSILVEGGEMPLASVRLSAPIPKAKIFDVMNEIRKVKRTAPVHEGEVVIENVLGLGSNVIVTSLAMGLAMICSDVGSIRDYCDESNTIFCQNNDVSQFSDAITILSQNRNKLAAMQKSAIQKSKLLTIERFAQELTKL